MPRTRMRPTLDRRASFARLLPETGAEAATAAWEGMAPDPPRSRWVAVRDFTGAELVAAGGEVAEVRSRFVVRADSFTSALTPRSWQVTDERGVWDIVSVSRSPLRGAFLELLCTLRS